MARPTRVSRTVGEQVRRHRDRKGWSQARLADELLILAEPIDRVVLHRIEKGTRGVSVDEVLILALALGVSPAHLMLPNETMAPVEVAAGFPPVRGYEALSWLRGTFPLLPADHNPDEEELRFFYESVSDSEAAALRRHPHVFEAWMGAGSAMFFAQAPGQEEQLRSALEQVATTARLALEHLDSTMTTTMKGS